MNNGKLIEKATDYIDVMAAKLGVAAEHVYGLLVRQQITTGIVSVIVAPLVMYTLYRIIKLVFRKYEENKNDTWSDWPVAAVVASVFGGVAGILMVVLFFDGVQHIINPEYYAIKELLDVFGGSN